jgi:hypothetical protein
MNLDILRVWRPRDYGRENQAIGLSRWRILMELESYAVCFTSFDLISYFVVSIAAGTPPVHHPLPPLPPHRGGHGWSMWRKY